MKKYVIFKDDDVGKDFNSLKKWIDIIINNNAKAAIGLIGKYIKNQELNRYLNLLDSTIIEVFCHGYSHGYLPFIFRKYWKKNRLLPVEFDRNSKSHDHSLRKYRFVESKYLKKKAVCFGPPGNVWNESVINPLLENDFKLMFSWRKAKHDLFTIPLSDNLKQRSLKEFIADYDKKKDCRIYTLQFHHANLSDRQYELTTEVIDFLKDKENRIFITPSELLDVSKKDKDIFNLISPIN
ncbi:MAG: hypothetical protein JSU91_05285 [Thermoplasmatales archaeon]|nr:MAG: hypothetical protein JSU91_05285 [Thermoplasmatales archaeon]